MNTKKIVLIAVAMTVALGGLGFAQQGVLTDDEVKSLLYMREEEKLARDVYQALYEQWNFRVFSNIANGEQQHMDAVLTLVDRYGLTDPVLAAGSFTNPELQKLYDDLVARGSRSLDEALRVSALIEEVDIKDLDETMSATSASDLRIVYASLRRGSESHLRAFTLQLGDYTPQVLDQAEYLAIVADSGSGNGNGYRGGR